MTWLGGPLREQPYCCLNGASIFMFTEIRALIKGKTSMWIEFDFHSKVARSCEKITDLIKLEATLWV